MVRYPFCCFALLIASALFAADGSSGIWIVAHRGAKNIAPENTIAAFEAAAKAGANYVEVDVRQARDGALVLMHDATVDRTTNGKGLVRDLSLAEIQALDAGRGERVPTFRDVLIWGKARNVMVDIDHKDGNVEDIVRVIRATGMIGRVVIEGGRDNLRRFVELLPGVDTMPKVADVSDVPRVCGMLKTSIVRLSSAQLHMPEMVRAVRACPARVSITILGQTDTEEVMTKAAQLGAELIETDHPDVLDRVRQKLSAQPSWQRR